MPANRVLDFRIFRFHPGRRDEFATRFQDQLLPMLKRHGVEIIHYGPSLHDKDSFIMIRAWPSVSVRQATLDTIFGGAEWLTDQEEEVLGMIDTMDSCVLDAGERLITAMKEGFASKVSVGDERG